MLSASLNKTFPSFLPKDINQLWNKSQMASLNSWNYLTNFSSLVILQDSLQERSEFADPWLTFLLLTLQKEVVTSEEVVEEVPLAAEALSRWRWWEGLADWDREDPGWCFGVAVDTECTLVVRKLTSAMVAVTGLWSRQPTKQRKIFNLMFLLLLIFVRHFYQAATCFCCFNLSCPIFEKDIFIKNIYIVLSY